MGLMRVLDTVQSGYASLARIVGVVIDPPAPVPDSGAPRGDGSVDMRNISFRYGDSSWAVEGLNLAIKPGETVALVGASGAGKSTVAALLAGLRVPDEGTVLVDGVEVALLSDAERIQRLALVSQEVHVFSGSLREDLALAAPQATDEEMVQTLRQVQADWFFDLEAASIPPWARKACRWTRWLRSNWHLPESCCWIPALLSWTKPRRKQARWALNP